ncbi:hypothetical protein AM1_C0165 (plasmid) [Acaryochloris marina MBIC11017]|uniref:Uncharacterized protein n=1 Tax=Acaryochloris marina (strain MBIC 11017) TaxID=329726 RepID=A8ZMQ7_ACAM1|nr:hypothetical protein AM1_C0165 [Acaryochloris marina MBIC11017]
MIIVLARLREPKSRFRFTVFADLVQSPEIGNIKSLGNPKNKVLALA